MRSGSALGADEAGLARAAAAGDGSAFAALYERYERRVFNLAYRTTGSEADAADAVEIAFLHAIGRPQQADSQPAFRISLLAATHNACHDLMGRGTAPSQNETGAESSQEEVREASMRLPERQREVLALRELEELPYEEIGTIMEVNRDSVAQLISRARINLHDELRGNVLASVAAPSPECEQGLRLLAMREDGQLDADAREAAWLDSHLADCDRCGLGIEAMQEAKRSYRSWAPIAATPWLLNETMAKAATLAGADWSEETAKAATARTSVASLPGIPSAYLASREDRAPASRRGPLAIGLTGLILVAALVAIVTADDGPPASAGPGARAAVGPGVAVSKDGANGPKADKANGGDTKREKGTAAAETIPLQTATEGGDAPGGSGAPGEPASQADHPSSQTAVQPTRQPSAPKPSAAPTPAPTPAPAPAPAPAPPPAEEVDEPPKGRGPIDVPRGPPKLPALP